jgi:EmrB/QacA subfamily drug resistance transporter
VSDLRLTEHTRAPFRLTFLVILSATVAYGVMQSLVTPVLPTIQHALHTSQSNVTWVLTSYLLAASIATPIIGRLGDMMGKKKVLVSVLIVFGLGTLLAAVATNLAVMIIARAIQGVAGAILPLSFGIIRDEFPREKVPMAIGITAAIMSVGSGLGIVLAGPIVSATNWHFLFWLPLVVIVVATIAAALFIPESPNRVPGRISLLPAALITLWLVALLVAVSEGSEWGWTSGRVLGLLAVALVLVPLWILSENRAAQPLIDMRMMRIPAVWTSNLVSFLFGMGIYGVMGFLPEFLQTPSSAGYGFGASVTESGLFLLPMTVTMFLFGLASGRLGDLWGPKIVLVLGSSATVAALAILVFAHDTRGAIYVFSGLLGIGFGFAFAAMSTIVVGSVPVNQVGVASGMNANIRTIGGAIGAAITGTIVTSGAHGGLPVESGYTHGFVFLLVGTVVGVGAALLVPSDRRRTRARNASVAAEVESHVVLNGETALVAGAPLAETD